MSPEFEDCTVTPVCPSTVTVLAFESMVIAPLDVASDTAASPAEISSAAAEDPM